MYGLLGSLAAHLDFFLVFVFDSLWHQLDAAACMASTLISYGYVLRRFLLWPLQPTLSHAHFSNYAEPILQSRMLPIMKGLNYGQLNRPLLCQSTAAEQLTTGWKL